MKPANKNAKALAGEFAALSQLVLRNYDANMTLGHTKGVDILVSIPNSSKMYRLEVKTKVRSNDKQEVHEKLFGRSLGGWVMNKKHEARADSHLFYCFVIIWDLRKEKKFRFFIIPSKVVARYVREEHQHWRERSKGKTNDIRKLRIGFKGEKYEIKTPTVEKYENNWKFRR